MKPRLRVRQVLCVCLLVLALLRPEAAQAYAVLSHEAIIDAAWNGHIKALLLKKYPQATEEDLSRAQAYAYGGAIIQDMGYYPYGSPFFSDLTHYVRSGDFVRALLHDAQDLTRRTTTVIASARTAQCPFSILGWARNTATAWLMRTANSPT